MDVIVFSGIVGAAVILLMGILFAWTALTTTTIKTEAQKMVVRSQLDSDKDIALISLKSKELDLTTKENIASAKLNFDSSKLQLDYEIRAKEALIREKEIDSRLVEEKSKQIGKLNRLQLECDTKTQLNQQNNDFQRQKLLVGKEMFDLEMDFKHNVLKNDRENQQQQLNFKMTKLESKASTSKYLADTQLKSILASEENKNVRSKIFCDTNLQINKNMIGFKKKQMESFEVIEKRRIDADLSVFRALQDTEVFKQKEKTKRSEIRSQDNLLNTALNIFNPESLVQQLPGIISQVTRLPLQMQERTDSRASIMAGSDKLLLGKSKLKAIKK